MDSNTVNSVIDLVNNGFSMVNNAFATLMVPGTQPRRVEVTSGESLASVLSKAGVEYSNKQTYTTADGNQLSLNDTVQAGDVIAVISTQSNG